MKLIGINNLIDLVNLLDEVENIVIVSHEDPDGDAIGSSLALYNYLKEYFEYKETFKSLQIVLSKVAERFKILKSYNEIKSEIDGEIDLLIVLDLNDRKRLGEFEYAIDLAKHVLVIDHHVGEPNFGNYKIMDEKAVSTSLIFFDIYNQIKHEIDLPNPSKEVVEAVLVGVISDTSGFKNANINKEVFEFVARAMAYDINVSEMVFEILANKSQNELALKSLVLNRLEYIYNARIAISYLLLSDKEYRERAYGEHEGLSDLLRDIQGVDIGILIREIEDGFKISLRTKKDINCKIIAEDLGGGGHFNAAGVTIKNKDLDSIKKDIIDKAREVLK